jgi:nicotinamidase-related amidase
MSKIAILLIDFQNSFTSGKWASYFTSNLTPILSGLSSLISNTI